MKEFEDSFGIQRNEDQAQAIADVKRDMESHSHGSAAVRRCWLWQDGGGDAGCLQGAER